jgi:hypothetical protein
VSNIVVTLDALHHRGSFKCGSPMPGTGVASLAFTREIGRSGESQNQKMKKVRTGGKSGAVNSLYFVD